MKKDEEEEPFLLLAHEEDESGEQDVWVLDTNANNYICGKRNIFVELDKIVGGQVTFGDSLMVPIKEKDKILIHLKNGKHQFISNVCYVLDMKNNILSIV